MFEAEEVTLRVSDESSDSVLPGAQTARVMAGQIQRFMPDAEAEGQKRREHQEDGPSQRVRDDIRRKLDLLVHEEGKRPNESASNAKDSPAKQVKVSKSFDSESRRLLASAFLSSACASLLVLCTYYGLREIRHQREISLWQQMYLNPNLSRKTDRSWDLDDFKMWASQSPFGSDSKEHSGRRTQLAMSNQLSRIASLRSTGADAERVQQEVSKIVELGTEVIPYMIFKFESGANNNNIAQAAAEVLAKFGSKATSAVSSAVMRSPNAPVEDYLMQAGTQGIRAIEMILQNGSASSEQRERAVTLLAYGISQQKPSEDSLHLKKRTETELVKVYQSTMSDYVRGSVVVCLRHAEAPTPDMIAVLEDAVRRHVSSADVVLEKVMDRNRKLLLDLRFE